MEQSLSEAIRSSLHEIHVHDLVDSTNLQALRLLESGVRDNHLIVANAQSSGRGRRGRNWLSPAYSGLYMSLLYFFPATRLHAKGADNTHPYQGLSLVTALSVFDALRDFCPDSLGLKWPNDVLVDHRKLAGILLEIRTITDCFPVVIGIGVNLNLSPSQRSKIDRPVSALNEWSDPLPASEMLAGQIMSLLLTNIEHYLRDGFAPFRTCWNSRDIYLGTEVTIDNDRQQLVGKSMGVDTNGALLLQTSDGEERISGGEVFPSLRSAAGVVQQ